MKQPRENRGRRLNQRALAAIAATMTGLALPVSGLADHLILDSNPAAGGNVACVIHWTCGLLFIVFVTWHVIINRKAYRRHIAEVSGGLLFSPRRTLQPPPRS